MITDVLPLMFDAYSAKRAGHSGIAERQRRRLAEIVAFARTNSPLYQGLYQRVPGRVADVRALPVTSKKLLMERFDEWATDRDVTLTKARAFVEDPTQIGAAFLGKYAVVTTSGTTGRPGIFLLDDRAFAVTAALASRMLSAWLKVRDVIRIARARGRIAMIMATHGHFASAVAAARMRNDRSGDRAPAVETLSANMPVREIVERLNLFQPAILAPYASLGAVLASEQDAGRLHIAPVLVALAAEGLPAAEYGRIAATFQATVGNSYAASECPFLSYSCKHGWLHVNADWVVLEAVDTEYRPVPPGQTSHTTLITNLANRVQPILRYDLGDRILSSPEPCRCGNPLPAIRVQGRTAERLAFAGAHGEQVAIPPLALEIDHVPGVDVFQIVQSGATSLRVRLRFRDGARPETVWRTIHHEISDVLGRHGLEHVTVELAEEPPEQSSGGKYRAVIPLEARGSGEVRHGD